MMKNDEATDGFNVMNETAVDQADEEALAYEASDDALEAAAGGSEAPGRTLYGCLPPIPLSVGYGCYFVGGSPRLRPDDR